MKTSQALASIASLREQIELQTRFLWRTTSPADRRKARAAIAAYTARIAEIQDAAIAPE